MNAILEINNISQNWEINGIDTGIKAKGEPSITIADGLYFLNGLTTGVSEQDVSKTQEGFSVEKEIRDTGFALYGDSQYTSVNPLVVAVNNNATIDLDGVGSVLGQLPEGVSLYDVATSKITPINSGDGYTFTLGFKGNSTSNNGGATFGIEIGGAFGEIFKRNFRFPRGIGQEHNFYFTSQGFTGDTFKANGGVLKIQSDVGTSSFYDFTLQIHRTHKAI